MIFQEKVTQNSHKNKIMYERVLYLSQYLCRLTVLEPSNVKFSCIKNAPTF